MNFLFDKEDDLETLDSEIDFCSHEGRTEGRATEESTTEGSTTEVSSRIDY